MKRYSIRLHFIIFLATVIFLGCYFAGCSQKTENLKSIDTTTELPQVTEGARLNNVSDWKYDDNTKGTLQVSRKEKD